MKKDCFKLLKAIYDQACEGYKFQMEDKVTDNREHYDYLKKHKYIDGYLRRKDKCYALISLKGLEEVSKHENCS